MRTLALYLAAAVVYIALGVWNQNFLFSWFGGAAYLLVAVWVIPTLVRRLGP